MIIAMYGRLYDVLQKLSPRIYEDSTTIQLADLGHTQAMERCTLNSEP